MERRGTEKEDLQSMRVLQRNLVYAVGISSEFAQEELLRSKGLFGGFGEIVKLVLSRRKDLKLDKTLDAMHSAYITYQKEESAKNAIREMDGYRLGDKILRCTFGTTKYCSFFLRGVKCGNEGCLYLHEKGRDEDSFSRDQMSALKHKIEHIIETKHSYNGIYEKHNYNGSYEYGKHSYNGACEKHSPETSSETQAPEENIEEIEELQELFLFKPKQEVRQRHYENCHFNPFYRKTSEGGPEPAKVAATRICAEK